MIELKGRFSTAKIYTNDVDYKAINQVRELLDSNLAKDSRIRVMPDTHAGADNVIGLTMTVKDIVSPALIGADIGCGIALWKLTYTKPISLLELDEVIKNKIPYGYLRRKEGTFKNYNLKYLSDLKLLKDKSVNQLRFKSDTDSGFGTLGGGNHFIEAYKVEDDPNSLYLCVHTGSRTIGGSVYKYYDFKAKNSDYDKLIAGRAEIVNRLKSQGKVELIQAELESFTKKFQETSNTDKGIRYLEGQILQDYIHDSEIINKYAFDNRTAIVEEIAHFTGAKQSKLIVDKPHNFLSVKDGVSYLRKGAQSAYPGENVLIPINMRDGVIVGVSKGDEDWNFSFPHGAGRVLSRSQARELVDIDEFVDTMKDVYSTTINGDTIDEAPMAYKTIESILTNVTPQLELGFKILKPIYNFKGGSEQLNWKEIREKIKAEKVEELNG